MTRTYAVSLGSLAMALVVLRGMFRGESADAVAIESIAMMIVFAIIGAFAGWIADHLIRDNVETLFRNRVDWYRQSIVDAGSSPDGSDITH